MLLPTLLLATHFFVGVTSYGAYLGATFPGCSNCRFNIRANIINAETTDEDGFGRGENDAYVTLYSVLVRIRVHIYTILSCKEFTYISAT